MPDVVQAAVVDAHGRHVRALADAAEKHTIPLTNQGPTDIYVKDADGTTLKIRPGEVVWVRVRDKEGNGSDA